MVVEVWHGDRCSMKEGCTKTVSSVYGVSLRKFIRSDWLNFSKLLRHDVGDGTRVKSWEHVWCGDCTLKEAFPEFYQISRARDSSIAEVMCFSTVRIYWDVQFCHSEHD